MRQAHHASFDAKLHLALRGLLFSMALAPAFAAEAAESPGAQRPPAEFVKRVADQYRAAMTLNDRDKNGRLTRDETRGSLLLEAQFDDIDANRDDVITTEEMERFLADLPASAR